MKIQLELTEEQAEYLRNVLNIKAEKSELEIMKEKYESMDYIFVYFNNLQNRLIRLEDNWHLIQTLFYIEKIIPIHKKHANILDAYLKDNSVEIGYKYMPEFGYCGKFEFEVCKNWIEEYQESYTYRLKRKEEYPQFRIDEDGYILKWEEESIYEVMISSSAKDIGKKFCRSIWNDLKPIPYNKERKLYHKQPCWYKIGEEISIGFYDINVDMLFNNGGHFGILSTIEPITLKQLKTMPFIWELYKQLED